MSKIYPYIWCLDNIKEYEIDFIDFHPYLEIYVDNKVAYVNLTKLGLNLDLNKGYSKELIDSYIKIISKIQNSFLTNHLNILKKNKNYLIEKYKYKRRYNKDYLYILKSCIKEAFRSNIIYLDRDKSLLIIYLDYYDTKENINLIEEIIDNFLPINFDCKYIFYHLCSLDVEELKNLERWTVL